MKVDLHSLLETHSLDFLADSTNVGDGDGCHELWLFMGTGVWSLLERPANEVVGGNHSVGTWR